MPNIDTVFNLGASIVPIIVFVFSLLGFFLCFLMPKNYTLKTIGTLYVSQKQLNKYLPEANKQTNKLEANSLLVYDALWVLSASIFGHI
ncbi:MAG: hypothetical protein MJ223_02565 [Mycoplasmoidaceae bacterium]|nr:hypothetical protein [Mycoplasmoidaceae bacterium]